MEKENTDRTLSANILYKTNLIFHIKAPAISYKNAYEKKINRKF